ncbi:FecCD family ABC transporter permease [Sporomusa termitida]|uniref:Hemin transport system permease protein HmuU n=1 Tax=Sporomusa termitida TaxID=2377 RepID=A0A517DNZ4_9FIRM|nr:iron ABC transporter permease [Sporomusa termitida]QDR79081.1 Hemin transport system permease protein HmuU [Sporomusa termitida]
MLKLCKQNKSKILVLIISFLLVTCLSLTFGQVDIPLTGTAAVLAYQLYIPGVSAADFTFEQQALLWYIRMPRTLVGLLVGAALAVAGAVLQGVFSNPLADPGLLGVASGAATGAVIAIAAGIGFWQLFALPVSAFAGATAAVSLTVLLSVRPGKIPVMPLLLAGMAVSILAGALTAGILTYINEQKLQQYLFWLVGSLDFRRWEHVFIAFWPIGAGITVLFFLARQLNVLALGETEARAVGMAVVPFRLLILLIASLITAAAVCVSGNIGFVGLIIPHIARLLVGPDHRLLLPVSALAGATFLVLCDTLGRVLIGPSEIRAGIMTALVGVPYFLYLLRTIPRQ